jgi:hypothetical protein
LSTSDSTTPAKRQTLSKKLRFEVFKRDDFTCQYCGAQPPAVVLEVDHIHPVVEGGSNNQENLITACDHCNRGKGKRTLGEKIVRPDADLMWLKTQQETAELRRYQKAKKRKEATIAQTVVLLQEHWQDLSGLSWAPSDTICRRLLASNCPEVVEQAFTVVAPKVASGKLRYDDQWRPYLYTVCRNLTNGTEPGEYAAKIKEAEDEIARLKEQDRSLRTFLYMLLLDRDASFFEFDQPYYAACYHDLADDGGSVSWWQVSKDEDRWMLGYKEPS